MKRDLIFFDADQFFLFPYGMVPSEGFEYEKDFPNCCSFHESHFEGLKKWFLKFPKCCLDHEELINKRWFNKEIYGDLPMKILNQVEFTLYHFDQVLDKENWEKEISHYVQYGIQSFGHPAIGAEHYLKILLAKINEIPNVDVEIQKKLDFIKSFIKMQLEPAKENQDKTDFQQLYATYQKWIDTIPNLTYFIPIKAKVTKQLPLAYDFDFNPYTGLTKAKLRTQKELLEFLTEATKHLLQNIDVLELIKKGVINNSDKYNIELITENHKLKQTKLFIDYTAGEKVYYNIITAWLENEKDFFSEIKPLLKGKTPRPQIGQAEDAFKKLFRMGWYDKTINYLKGQRLIDEQKDGKFKWIDESENTFIAVFWGLFELEFQDGNLFLIKPLPSISQYQNIVFDTFQIKKWSTEKFKKHKRHNYEVQAERARIKEELKRKMLGIHK